MEADKEILTVLREIRDRLNDMAALNLAWKEEADHRYQELKERIQ